MEGAKRAVSSTSSKPWWLRDASSHVTESLGVSEEFALPCLRAVPYLHRSARLLPQNSRLLHVFLLKGSKGLLAVHQLCSICTQALVLPSMAWLTAMVIDDD